MHRALFALLLCVCLIGCGKPWIPRTVPACARSTGAAELDRERSYYALLLALSEARYVVVHAEAPRQIEAEYYTTYRPGSAYLRWLIDVGHDGTLSVQSLPPERRAPRNQQRLFERLRDDTRRMQCHELSWLRWEAQNRGLVPMLADSSAGPPGAAPSTSQFATLPQPLPPGAAAAPHPTDPWLLVQSLKQQREQVHVWPGIAVLSAGIAFAAAAVPMGLWYERQREDPCDRSQFQLDDSNSGLGFCSRSGPNPTVLLVNTYFLAAVGGAGIVIGATLLHSYRERRRNLDRHLQLLERTQLGFDVGPRGASLGLRATF